MKQVFLCIALFIFSYRANAQITITASDMPVSGDTLRYSIASPLGSNINLGDSGANHTWDYSLLMPIAQAVDTYKTALSVNPLYVLISFSAYGYKVADSIPGLGAVLPVSITNIYTFFEKISNPNSYAAVAFAADIAGLPTPINYSTKDTWYFFPLNYQNQDSSDFALNISIPTLGGIDEVGYRLTSVDGWGTITTPYYTTPVNCIRVRSEIHETDSITLAGTTFGFPRVTVEYKWLINGQHYPALWVTTSLLGTTETITSIYYRDSARYIPNLAVPAITNNQQALKAWPNPSPNGIFNVDIPASWKGYFIEVFNIKGERVLLVQNKNVLNLHDLPGGAYLARISSNTGTSYLKLEK